MGKCMGLPKNQAIQKYDFFWIFYDFFFGKVPPPPPCRETRWLAVLPRITLNLKGLGKNLAKANKFLLDCLHVERSKKTHVFWLSATWYQGREKQTL